MTAMIYQLGDMNGSDGSIEPNGNDINPFVLALIDRPSYEVAYPGMDADLVGDADQSDGLLTNDDIIPFVDLLLSSSQTVPGPASLSLLALGACLLLLRRRRQGLGDSNARPASKEDIATSARPVPL